MSPLERDVAVLFATFVFGMTDNDIRIILACGIQETKLRRIYTYNDDLKDVQLPHPSGLRWTVQYVLQSFNMKHLFVRSRRPNLQDVSITCASFAMFLARNTLLYALW
mgnify:CR=1 FL=1